MGHSKRIEVLDGLRVIAILMVMLFHYYSYFEGTYYHYNAPRILHYGSLGVQLFFIISGFVISMTLTSSLNFIQFMKKRLIRLFPGMLICSCITFTIFLLFDTNNLIPSSKNVYNLILSNTFLPPALVNKLLSSNLRYIDPPYWSLWVEIQFYIVSGIIFFLSPKNYLRNYGFFTLITFSVYILVQSKYSINIEPVALRYKIGYLIDTFSLVKNNLWFLAGIVVYKMYTGENKKLIYLLLLIFAVQLILMDDLYAKAITASFLIFFIFFIYKRDAIAFLSKKWISKIGVASYSIYLIHQNIGLLIIYNTTKYLGSFQYIVPIFLIGMFTAFGLISYKYFESYLSKRLKVLLFAAKVPLSDLKTAESSNVER